MTMMTGYVGEVPGLRSQSDILRMAVNQSDGDF